MIKIQQNQTPEIDFFLKRFNSFYLDLLGYTLKQTSLQSILENQWVRFTQIRGLDSKSKGFYLPRDQTAIIQGENLLSLFHEYFGHGLSCEQSLNGRKLVDLEKSLLEQEKQEFKNRQFTLEDLQEFRSKNPLFQELDKFRKQNLAHYELFAIWTEYLLSKESGVKNEFEKKYSSLEREDQEAIDSAIDFSKNYGNLATFYEFGLARRTTPKRVKGLLQDIYREKLQNSKFILLYGSRKELSDIDVFAVSEDLPELEMTWLDVRAYSSLDFEKRLRLFDIAVIDPLVTGEFVLGEKSHLKQLRNQILQQPITEEAIRYNTRMSKEQRKMAIEYPEDSEERRCGLAYSESYLGMAQVLKQGKRKLIKGLIPQGINKK